MIPVIQINLNKSKMAHANLCQMLIKDKALIFIIQEPYYCRGRIPGIPPGYVVHGEKNSRAIIITRDTLNCAYHAEFSKADITTCSVLSDNGKKRYYVSLYLDINMSTNNSTFLNFADFVNANNEKAVVGADTNAHSVLWGCDESNKRGENLEEIIMTTDAYILNRGSEPTYVSSRYSTIIDVTLALNCSDEVSNWNVNREYQFSDHRMIQFNVKDTMPRPKLVPKINWKKLKQCLRFEDVHFSLWSYATIEQEAQAIEQIISKAVKDCTTMKPIKTANLRWWTDDLQKLKQEIRRLVKIYDRTKNVEVGETLKSKKVTYNKMIRKAKNENWQKFCDSIDSPESMAKFNKVIQFNTKKTFGMLKNSDGTYTKTVDEAITLLMDVCFPGSIPSLGGRTISAVQNRPQRATTGRDPSKISNKKWKSKVVYEAELQESFINDFKVAEAFKTFGPDKAAGPDGIRPRILQMLDNNAIKRITNLYRACLEIGYTPESWRKANVVFIPKCGKEDYSEVKSWRPISLTSFMLKSLERIVLWELEDKTLKIKPISKNQHAFRKGYSTETALSDFIDDVESAILRGQYALAVFCDIEAAFDTVQISSVVKAMRHFNVPECIVAWYRQYLENRYTECILNKVSKTRKLTKSTPQGGVLSPLVFSLIFESFLDLHIRGPVKSRAYADDGTLLIKGSCPDTMVRQMQRAVNKTLEWGVKHGLRFSPKKTIAMFFHRKNKWKEPKRKLKISGTSVEYADTTKYLGVHLDTKLRWNIHINNKIKSAKRQIMMIRNAIKTTWGPTPRALKWAYNGIVLPSLTYGCIIWSKVVEKRGVRNKLTQLNRLMAQTMMPMRRGTPTAGLEVILDLPPIDLKVKELALKAMARVLPHNRTKWDGLGKGNSKGHVLRGTTELRKLGINPANNDSLKWHRNLQRGYKVDLDSFKSGLPTSSSSTICYTDGSKMKNQTGFGLGITRENILIASKNGQLDEDNSVFQAEVKAIQEACIILREEGTREVTIFSDSQSALLALSSILTRSETVIDCISSLNKLSVTADVELKWVKAHADHTGNEYADMEAKTGTKNTAYKARVKRPLCSIKKAISDGMYTAWNQRWRAGKTCRQTKIWFPTIDRKNSKNLVNLKRLDLGLLTQMITGHNRLNRHESLINPEVDPTCSECCEEDEQTSWHIICECPALWYNREQIFGEKFLDLNPEWTVNQLMSFAQRSKLHQLNTRRA